MKTYMFRGELEVQCFQPLVEVLPEPVQQLVLELLEAGQDQVLRQLVGLNVVVPLLHEEDFDLQVLLEVLHMVGHLREDAVGGHAGVHARRHVFWV